MNRNGFTYIETMFAIILIFISFSLINISFFNLEHKKLEVIAQEIAEDLRKTQNLSIKTKDKYRIIFRKHQKNNKNSNYYSISKRDGNLYKIEKKEFIGERVFLKYISSNNNPLVFNKKGYVNKSCTLTLKNMKNDSIYIVIYRTGRIRISNEAP